MLQLNAGMVNVGLVVVCASVAATLYDQSQEMMVPGAVEARASKVQFSVLPLFVSVHVSDSVGPVTPNFAVATVTGVTESVAKADVPPYEPVTVPLIVPLTPRVEIWNVALSSPARTVMLGGTVRGSVPVSDTTAPPAGAPAVSITVPVTRFPPTTLGALSKIEVSAGAAVTVNGAD
jgi:hypothetical protein